MKKILYVLIVGLMFASIAGCSSNKSPVVDAVSLYVGEEKLISLSMNKKEIEEIIASDDYMNTLMKVDETKETYYKVYENNSFMINYKNDIPSAIILSAEGKKYTDCYGIKPKMTKDQLMENLEKAGVNLNYVGLIDETMIFLEFDKNGKLLDSTSLDNEKKKKVVTSLIMYNLEEDIVNSMSMTLAPYSN